MPIPSNPTLALPWFHTTALQQRYAAHALSFVDQHGSHKTALPWLQRFNDPQRDHQPGAVNEMRVDQLTAITASGRRIELPLTLLISRTAEPAVYLYNPLTGLQVAADRQHAKSELLEQLNSAQAPLALTYPDNHKATSGVDNDPAVAIEVSLLEGSVSDALMLRINDALSAQADQLRQVLRAQPTPAQLLGDDPLGPAPGAAVAQRLKNYWMPPESPERAPATVLGEALHRQLANDVIQGFWNGTLGDAQYRLLWQWLDADATPAPESVHSFTLSVVTPAGQRLALDDLLLLASPDRHAPCYAYSAAKGLLAFSSQIDLLTQLADPTRRADWLGYIASAGRPALTALSISGVELQPTPQGLIGGYVERLLRLQQLEMQQRLDGQTAPDRYTLCLQGLNLEERLASIRGALGAVAAADLRDSPASLVYLSRSIAHDMAVPQSLATHLSDLHLQYTRYQSRQPTLVKVLNQLMEAQLAYLLPTALSMAQVRLADPANPGHTLTLTEAVNQPPQATVAAWQIVQTVAEGQQVPITELPPVLIEHVIQRTRELQASEFDACIAYHARLGEAYRLKLHATLHTLEQGLAQQLKTLAPSAQIQNPTEVSVADAAATLRRDANTALQRMLEQGWPLEAMSAALSVTLVNDALLAQVQRAQGIGRQLAARQATPLWLANASEAHRQAYLRVLASGLLTSPGEDDYLFGMPDISSYAQTKLQDALDHDFATGRFLPTAIFITTQRYISALPAPGDIPSALPAASERHRQSLVEYALNHFRDWDHAITAIELGEGHAAPAELDADYVRRLVKRMDIGLHYQAQLQKTFEPTSSDYPRRLDLYCRQLPSQLMECAWRACLKDGLAQNAVELIDHVLRHPDASLRPPLNGQTIDLMPLQLSAGADLAADAIPDCYLFASRGPGPQVLYMPYAIDGVLQAFNDPAALQRSLLSDTALQKRLLMRMPETMRTRYDYGGFLEPHLEFSAESDFDFLAPTPGPAQLHRQPVSGNALRYLFEENRRYLQVAAASQLVTAAQARWHTVVNVLRLAWEQLSMFLPGKAGLVLAGWQIELGVLDIAVDVRQKNWGQTLAELVCALVQGWAIGAGALSQQRTGTQLWRSLRRDEHLQLPLARYAAPSTAANELRYDASSHTYEQLASGQRFANLRGGLYHVRNEGGRWYLTVPADGEAGPALALEADDRWWLDPEQPIELDAGGVPSSLGGRATRWVIGREAVVILAVGTRRIRRMMPQRADMLINAHGDAVRLLGICLANLNRATPARRAPLATLHIIKDFFGVAHVTDDLVQRIREQVEKTLRVMTSLPYSPHTSKRYVMASNVLALESLGVAFTSSQDPSRQIFLLDEYFDLNSCATAALQPQYSVADANALSRAVVLLHEFTHVACDTRDIHYIEALAPYADHLVPGRRRAWLSRQHDESFSHRTPAHLLFTVRGSNGQIRDLRPSDRKGHQLILRLAGSRNLADARQRFLADGQIRARIMLMNADSLSLLIYRLGTTLHQL